MYAHEYHKYTKYSHTIHIMHVYLYRSMSILSYMHKLQSTLQKATVEYKVKHYMGLNTV